MSSAPKAVAAGIRFAAALAVVLALQFPAAGATKIRGLARAAAAGRRAAAVSASASATAAAASASGGRLTSQTKQSLLLRQGADLLTPLPNDTIAPAYWVLIDSAIQQAGLTTPPPVPSNALTKPTQEPYQKVFTASRAAGDISAEDLTPEEVQNAQELQAVEGVAAQDASAAVRRVPVVPYDMQLGARIMYGLTEHATETPPPTQGLVSQQFVAQCPMIMFTNSLQIGAPRCGATLGDWTDPATDRKILRWEPMKTGGLRFGVDSVIGGNGSTTYAELNQEMSLQGIYFNLMNCLDVMRYTVEETVMKVHHIGQGVTSSIQEHDISTAAQAFFYKYTIRHPNGSAVAETSLFRQNQNQINVTMLNDEVANGALVATVTREGHWNQAAWRECSGSKRAWNVEFKISSRDFETVATVMDLRVATAATITLMAFRDEAVNRESGVNRQGEQNMVKQMPVRSSS